MPRPRGGDWLIDEVKDLRETGVDVLVSLLMQEEIDEVKLTEEANYCQEQGIIYHSYPIIDHNVPPFNASTFTFLEQLATYLSQGQHVAVHCFQGLGRSVLVAACLLVLNGFTAEQACYQLSVARGYSVPETDEQRAWVVAFAQRQRSLNKDQEEQ
jgi:protein-tyrosine phosphatase